MNVDGMNLTRGEKKRIVLTGKTFRLFSEEEIFRKDLKKDSSKTQREKT